MSRVQRNNFKIGCPTIPLAAQSAPSELRTVNRFGPAALETAALFGLDLDLETTAPPSIIGGCDMPLPPGGIVFVTGPSGGGKSTLLRAIAAAAEERDRAVIAPPTSSRERSRTPIVDHLAGPPASCERAHRLLALAGLGEARIMLQSPDELSEGQVARFQIADVLDRAERAANGAIVLIDEFCSALDRITARNVARMVRRWMVRAGGSRTLILAAAHDDLLEPLAPDVLVFVSLGGRIQIHVREEARA